MVQNIFGSGSDLDRKTGLRIDDDTTLSDPLEDVSLGITTSSRVSKLSDGNAQGSDVNQSCFIRDVFLVLKEGLFNVWTEENDPTLIRPFQDPPAVASVAKKSDDSNKDTENDPTVSADPAQTANPAEDPASAAANPEGNTSEGSEEVPKKPVRIS
jgi:hypothetical protein